VTDPAIAAFYERAPEETRLEQLPFRLEEIRTRELIERHAPPPPAVVVDVGGGAGAYALWLADAGFTVHLVDAAPRLIAEARRRSGALERPLASCGVGDARALELADGCAHAVLLLGPLYHLTDSADRMRALRESDRVLTPGGVLFAAAISRYASALDGLARDLFADPRFTAIVEQDLTNGQHRNPTDRLDYFTTAYFHRPEDLRAEIEGAGFLIEGVYGLEGPGWFLPDLAERWAHPRQRADLLRLARQLQAEPSVLGISAHLLAVARKPPVNAAAPGGEYDPWEAAVTK
jgi:ubiquinone/menaquinone biosynthesis C-methylase UbiE